MESVGSVLWMWVKKRTAAVAPNKSTLNSMANCSVEVKQKEKKSLI
jgi:hypothetical protein